MGPDLHIKQPPFCQTTSSVAPLIPHACLRPTLLSSKTLDPPNTCQKMMPRRPTPLTALKLAWGFYTPLIMAARKASSKTNEKRLTGGWHGGKENATPILFEDSGLRLVCWQGVGNGDMDHESIPCIMLQAIRMLNSSIPTK